MKLAHIQIQTNNIQQTLKFYTTVLGLSIVKNNEETLSIQAGNSILEFVENPQFNSIYHFAFNIPENKLDEAIEWCKNKVDLIFIEDQNVITNFENWNANAVYFYDNNGNLLEFIARHDLNNAQNESFSSKSILNISEIGIVNENPLALGKELIAKHNLKFFSKNDNSELFAAVGDDEGLLIIVKPNRNWYPTQTPSQSNKTQVRIENNEIQSELFF
ncbi:VOC family protein [Flavobacterium hibernum]|uniref:Glyoxalase n=1 Tax=Flavobacterium hibernum TaxID=37752 RepID=A0A0D0EX33_9FLAO|nr:VOC family protein [Flavobacterium hibernum]KIO51706.1 glyoxalase [Flavobacterium hibernum]OXA91736.1 glyoxalase/bleomycin resistance/dioxygenase family protein [Flavobacterium hibernum]STO09771.1 catechol 2,3 dioxygenase [Flavobacterium hibernum]